MRMTKRILEKKLDNLKAVSGKPYKLEYIYNGWRLCKVCNEHGGVTDLSERVSISEMARLIDTLIMVYHKM